MWLLKSVTEDKIHMTFIEYRRLGAIQFIHHFALDISRKEKRYINFFVIENKTFALERAKQNIADYYTIVGIVEELYNFLFVLENLMPRYFANIRLQYMANGRTRIENMGLHRGNYTKINETTRRILRLALANEYELYEFIKQRFYLQFQQVLKKYTY